ncbi:MAG: transcription-repair coupling factor [Desulfovibrionaceae bacterium]
MDTFNTFFAARSGVMRLNRTGLATRCRLANQWLAAGRNVIFVTQNRDEYHNARALLTLFCPEMSLGDLPLHQARWDYPIIGLPPKPLATGQGSAWPEHMAALFALRRKKARCVILHPDNLLVRLMPVNFFDEHELCLSTGAELEPDLLLEQAVDWGFERSPMVTRAGDVARRGDILDIFPPGYERPVRMEFFGDTIEEMRIFDPASQRSLHTVTECTILPVRPVATSASLNKKARERWDRLFQKAFIGEAEHKALLRDLDHGGRNLLPGTFYDASSVLEEWLPKDAVWMFSGEQDFMDQLASGHRTLSTFIEGEESPLPQSARLALRAVEQPQHLWQSSHAIFAEPLVMGPEHEGLPLPEHQWHSFTDLFPLPNAQDRPWQHLAAALKEWQGSKRQAILTFSSDRGRKKFLKLAEQDGIIPALRYAPHQHGLFALVAPYRLGMELTWDNSLVLGEDIMYPKAEKGTRVASGAFRGLDRFDDLQAGDLLVHRDYGIGRFGGLHRMGSAEVSNDFLLLEYSGEDKLYVPADRLSLIQRFKGADGADPALDRLGGSTWLTGKEKTRKAIEQIAADLVEMYAYRKVAKGFRYDPPGELYHEFEATFGFDETPDQAQAIQDVLDDMDKNEPMDRLVCGDVGFGKTEVALRAAFRAAAEGRQVVMLCPTTVLAEQHYQTFRARLAGFPINVGLLSRFVTRQKQQETLAATAKGQIDILVGTHRLLSTDVKVPNLALLILDEEQRFGVRHKEKMKALKKNVDVLTLTATPIPRTLQLSMSGIRELSIIETAPPERKPVATALLRRDPKLLKEIVQREIAREGQIFWVYNRVQGLEKVKEFVHSLVPKARIGMAHGQMAEKTLEDTMHKFWHGELDVLVCTSIVESGLDFPRANTLIVDQAQMFGLGQLYQLRGRVGRSDRQAYAVFLLPPEEALSEIAQERMRIILEMDYLGAGFQVAMEDLRLRGAGNILGEVQTGHMARVGLELYLEMLEEAVARLKGAPPALVWETEVNLGLPAHIPEHYIDDGHERLRCYKALTSATSSAAREEVSLGMRDRFGPFPPELETFLAVLHLKHFLTGLQVLRADVYAERVRITWAEASTNVSPTKLIQLVNSQQGAKLMPPATLEIPLNTTKNISQRVDDLCILLATLKKATPSPVAAA